MLQLFSVNNWLKSVFEGGCRSHPQWKQLVYNLCLFHSAINARRRIQNLSGGNTDSIQATDLQVFLSTAYDMYVYHCTFIMPRGVAARGIR